MNSPASLCQARPVSEHAFKSTVLQKHSICSSVFLVTVQLQASLMNLCGLVLLVASIFLPQICLSSSHPFTSVSVCLVIQVPHSAASSVAVLYVRGTLSVFPMGFQTSSPTDRPTDPPRGRPPDFLFLSELQF